MNTAIIACKTISDELRHAMAQTGTDYPVVWLEQGLHNVPELLRSALQTALDGLEAQRVLLAMGFCGNAIRGVEVPACELIIPRVDDCISLLLHTDDAFHPNLKEDGHLYLYENDPQDFSALTLMHNTNSFSQDLDLKNLSRDFLCEMWFHNYRQMDIIYTGLNDCYIEEYAAAAQAQADQIKADLDYVPGGYRLLTKLISGRWDEQFLVAPPGKKLLHGDFFG